MDDFEELKRRKEKLQLEHDIEWLERQKVITKFIARIWNFCVRHWRFGLLSILPLVTSIFLLGLSVVFFSSSPFEDDRFWFWCWLVSGSLLMAFGIRNRGR